VEANFIETTAEEAKAIKKLKQLVDGRRQFRVMQEVNEEKILTSLSNHISQTRDAINVPVKNLTT
jgi:hypothetical protein